MPPTVLLEEWHVAARLLPGLDPKLVARLRRALAGASLRRRVGRAVRGTLAVQRPRVTVSR